MALFSSYASDRDDKGWHSIAPVELAIEGMAESKDDCVSRQKTGRQHRKRNLERLDVKDSI